MYVLLLQLAIKGLRLVLIRVTVMLAELKPWPLWLWLTIPQTS